MDITNLSTSVLKSILSLTERRESLLSELGKVEASIAAALGGKAPAQAPVRRGRRPKATAAKSPATPSASKATKKSSRRGALKDSIVAELRAAGDKGVSVKELSSKLGVKNQNIHVWFSSTGRKLGIVQKVGAGRYRLKAGA